LRQWCAGTRRRFAGGGVFDHARIVPARAARGARSAACSLVSRGEFVCNSAMADDKRYEITVTTRTQFVPDQSDDAASRFVFAYTIIIRNTGSMPAQLISRHWIISNSQGEKQEVRGLGVIGSQPLLKPGESFEYTSGTAITTAVGTMRGSYQMVAEDGTQFEADIPEFTLAVPRVLH
jgi:ApaG protein